jgi:hypothetical protein
MEGERRRRASVPRITVENKERERWANQDETSLVRDEAPLSSWFSVTARF